MLSPLRRSLGLKLLVAVGLPSFFFAVLLLFWLWRQVGAVAPELAPVYRVALGAVFLFAGGMAVLHVLTVRTLVGQPIERLHAGLRRAREGGFLHRLPVESEDAIGALARDFNTTLAAITDLHARRIEDAASMESMKRELALKTELEARVRELTLLSDLSRRLASTLELDRLLGIVAELVGRGLGDHAFALLLAEEGTGDLVVRAVHGVAEEALGSRIQVGRGPGGRAARERATVSVPDTAASEDRPLLPWQGIERGSILCVPMLHRDDCVGVLAFFRPVAGAFPQDEIRLLESVAGQAATAFENARLHQKMVRLSQTDPLTGVHNRRSLFSRLDLEAARCERFDHAMAIGLVDVDRFKEFNEAHGHAAGDAVLRRVAELLQGSVRKVDLVARYGGEEFAILLPRADRAAALAAAEKLRAAVRAAAAGPDSPVPVTISVGVAVWPDDARDLPTLIDCADAALYAAKRAGRDAVRAHEPGMRTHLGRKRDVGTTADAEGGS